MTLRELINLASQDENGNMVNHPRKTTVEFIVCDNMANIINSYCKEHIHSDIWAYVEQGCVRISYGAILISVITPIVTCKRRDDRWHVNHVDDFYWNDNLDIEEIIAKGIESSIQIRKDDIKARTNQIELLKDLQNCLTNE